MHYWLFKTEPDVYSLDDLAREGTCGWEGIRNYQARNRLRDEVQPGDQVFVYHSSCKEPAVVGLAEVVRAAYPDPTQFDAKSSYFDPKSSPDNPRWLQVDIRYQGHLGTPVTLRAIKQMPQFQDMELVSRGRLSIQKVGKEHARQLLALAE